MEDNVISELVRTIVKGISNAGVQYSNKAAEFHSNITNHVRIYQRDNAILLNDMNKKDRHIKVFACVEQYCRELQMTIKQALTTTGPSLSMTSPSTAYTTTTDTSSPNRFHLRPGTMNNNYRYKKVNVNSIYTNNNNSIDEIDDTYPLVVEGNALANTMELEIPFRSSHSIPIQDRVDSHIYKIHAMGQAGQLQEFFIVILMIFPMEHKSYPLRQQEKRLSI